MPFPRDPSTPREVHILGAAEGFQTLGAARSDFERLRRWDGTSRAETWTPLPVTLHASESDRPLRPSDFPSLGGPPPVFSRTGVDALADILEPRGELLPLVCDTGEFFAYNCTTIVDALDEEASEIDRFRSSGRISNIRRHAFHPQRLEGAMIFKAATIPTLHTYVTDSFLQRTDDAHLSGFARQPVWTLPE